jgi:hypothetical protein
LGGKKISILRSFPAEVLYTHDLLAEAACFAGFPAARDTLQKAQTIRAMNFNGVIMDSAFYHFRFITIHGDFQPSGFLPLKPPDSMKR